MATDTDPPMTAFPDGQGLALVHIETDRGLWRPNAEGYTGDPKQAGVWTRSEAERMTAHLGPEKRLRIHAAALRASPREQTDGAGREWTTTPSERQAEREALTMIGPSASIGVAILDDLETALAEIEALKAERDEYKQSLNALGDGFQAELERRIKAEARIAELEAAIPPVAPGGISEEALARIIDPEAFKIWDDEYAKIRGLPADKIGPTHGMIASHNAREAAKAKARACLALVAPVLARCERERDEALARAMREINAELITRQRRIDSLTREVERVREALEHEAIRLLTVAENIRVGLRVSAAGMSRAQLENVHYVMVAAAAAIRARSAQAEGRPSTQAEPHRDGAL